MFFTSTPLLLPLRLKFSLSLQNSTTSSLISLSLSTTMTDVRRRPTPTVTVEEDKAMDSDPSAPAEEPELARKMLRQRWELACVLNFYSVFEPVLGSKMKVSGEDIETALIEVNNLLAQLHISLLKGIPPVSKTLNSSDAWVGALCKKLSMWWPWVAEGDIPITAAKGEEVSRYKELDPTIRLQILKALCEIRADQDDLVAYINDALKNGTEITSFRKDKVGGDGNGTAYWLDGNTTIGYRLYKEVSKFELKPKVKGKGSLPNFSFQWETLATNLEEFRKVVDEFSSSELKLEVAVAKTIETDAIPVLDKLNKKKEKALKQQERQERLLNGFRNSEITRSCRNRRPVCYTFDDYDKAIDEALHVTKRRKSSEERRHVEKQSEHGKENGIASDEGRDKETNSGEVAVNSVDSTENDTETESDKLQGGDGDDDESDDDYDGKKDDNNNDDEEYEGYSSNSDKENIDIAKKNRGTIKTRGENDYFAHKPKGSRWSLRQAGSSNDPVLDIGNLGAKNRLRQRPTRNTALESTVIPDSEDENSLENTGTSMSDDENDSDG